MIRFLIRLGVALLVERWQIRRLRASLGEVIATSLLTASYANEGTDEQLQASYEFWHRGGLRDAK